MSCHQSLLISWHMQLLWATKSRYYPDIPPAGLARGRINGAHCERVVTLRVCLIMRLHSSKMPSIDRRVRYCRSGLGIPVTRVCHATSVICFTLVREIVERLKLAAFCLACIQCSGTFL